MINRVPYSSKSRSDSSAGDVGAKNSQKDVNQNQQNNTPKIEAIYDALTSLLLNGPEHHQKTTVIPDTVSKDEPIFGYQFESEIFPSVSRLIDFYVSNKRPITRDSMCIISEPVSRPDTYYCSQQTKDSNRTDQSSDDGPVYYMACLKNPVENLDFVVSAKMSASKTNLSNRPLPHRPDSIFVVEKDPKGDRDSGIDASSMKHHGKGLDFLSISQESIISTLAPNSSCAKKVDDEDYEDYHEYCDIDYEDPESFTTIKDVVFRASQKINKFKNKPAEKSMLPDQPALPPRKLAQDVLAPSENFYDVSSSRNGLSIPNNFEKLPRLPPRCSGNQKSGQSIDIYDQPTLIKQQNHLDLKTQMQNFVNRSTSRNCRLISTFDLDLNPLDDETFAKINRQVLDMEKSDLAREICREDYRFLMLENRPPKNFCWADLIISSFARKFREKIVERDECWQNFLVASLVKCQILDRRVEILAKWIDTAMDLLEKCRNLYAFCYLMAGLESQTVITFF